MKKSTMQFAENERVDLPGVVRAIARILNTCQICGRRIVAPKGVDSFTAKFNVHRCPWDRRSV